MSKKRKKKKGKSLNGTDSNVSIYRQHKRIFEETWSKFLVFDLPVDLYKVCFAWEFSEKLICANIGSFEYIRRYC